MQYCWSSAFGRLYRTSNDRTEARLYAPMGSNAKRCVVLCGVVWRGYRPDTVALRTSLVAEANVVELFRDEPEDELGLRIVGGKDTPLGNIVIQEIVRDSLAARDGRLAPGDHILEVSGRGGSR